MTIPDFGMHRITVGEGTPYPVELECAYVAPGLTLHDLVKIFDKAEKKAKPGDNLSANPSKWPVVRGVSAVTDAILKAVYDDPSNESLQQE